MSENQEKTINDLLEKYRKLDHKKQNRELLKMINSQLLMFYPEYFDIITTQENVESQAIIYDVLNSKLSLNKKCMQDLLCYSNNPEAQKKIFAFYNICDICENEKYFITMMNVTDEYVEKRLLECFKRGLITNTEDLEYYKKKYTDLSFMQNKIKKVLRIKK